jgi:predicted MFS family arabinose efflux permease
MGRNLRDLWTISATSFLLWNSWLAFAPVFPLHVDDLGFSYFHLGILLAIPSVFCLFLTVPIGAFAYQRRKRVILASLALQSVSFLILGFLCDWPSLLAAQALYGMAASFFPPIITATVNSLCERETRGRMFGMFFTINGSAAISGPLLGSSILQYLSLSHFFQLLSLFPAVGFGIYLLKGLPDIQEDASPAGSPNGGVGSILRVLRHKGAVALCASQLLLATASAMFSTLFSVYVRDALLITSALVSSLFLMKGISNTVLRLPSGQLADRVGRKRPVMLSYFLLMVVFYLFSEAESFALIAVIMAIYGVAFGLRIVPQTALMCDLLGNEDAGVGMALLQTMFPLGSTIGSILSGWIVLGVSVQTVFKLSSVMLIPAIIALATVTEGQGEEARL